MTVTLSFYSPADSWLHRLDPRPKLWFSLLGVLICVLTTRTVVLIGVLTLTHAVLLAGRQPPRSLARLWRAMLPILVMILVLQPLLAPGEGPDLWRVGPVRLTEAGLLTGLHYALRVAAGAFVASLPVMTTPVNTLVYGLHKAGLPYSWGMAIGLALRYLGTVGELYTTISEAQQARGLSFSRGGIVKRVRAAAPTLIALIIASLRLSDSLALGLAARGYGLKRQRTYWRNISMRPVDWLAVAVITLAFAGMLPFLR